MIWIDVEDLFRYVRHNPRPSGIQRVEYELCRALVALDSSTELVRFVRRDGRTAGYFTVSLDLLERDFQRLTGSDQEQASAVALESSPAPHRSWAYRRLKGAVDRLRPRARTALMSLLYHQKSALLAALELLRIGVGARRRDLRKAELPPQVDAAIRRTDPAVVSDFERDAQPGDVLLLLGAAWSPDCVATVEETVTRKRMRLAMLIYDIVPLRRPEWCDTALIGAFSSWIHSLLPRADLLLTISRATAADLVRYAAERGLALKCKPAAIPMGTGFTSLASPQTAEPVMRRMPPPGSYALIVSTIEARKNHALLVRVWRRLLDEMPADTVPTLVFAGHVGWLVSDLITQLRNTDFLGGKIVLIEDPTDGELEVLYEGCMFTLFPSFYEGWGLPVKESLAYGRPCIISSATALPEVGGNLARYFDPDDASEAAEVIRAVLDDPAGLDAWRARIAREFQPTSWETSALAILAALEVRPLPPAEHERAVAIDVPA